MSCRTIKSTISGKRPTSLSGCPAARAAARGMVRVQLYDNIITQNVTFVTSFFTKTERKTGRFFLIFPTAAPGRGKQPAAPPSQKRRNRAGQKPGIPFL